MLLLLQHTSGRDKSYNATRQRIPCAQSMHTTNQGTQASPQSKLCTQCAKQPAAQALALDQQQQQTRAVALKQHHQWCKGVHEWQRYIRA
jgi:hypothetical protein